MSTPSDASRPAKIPKLDISSLESLPYEASPLNEKEGSDGGRDDLDPCLFDVLGEEEYFKMFDDHGPHLDEYGVDGMHDMTDAELEQYVAAMKLSGGFGDIPHFPDVDCCGLVMPLTINDYLRRTLEPFCVEAVKHFNKEQHKNYKFLELVKVNSQTARAVNHYLTFKALNLEDKTTQTFQAKVLQGIPEKKGDDFPMEVYFCRLKDDSTKREEKVENED